MSTVAEIEKAIGDLPAEQVLELGKWFEEYQLMLASSAAVFQQLDAEEGEGTQWDESGLPEVKSGS